MKLDKKYCTGCESNYYNHGNNSTTGECWHFKSARVVKMFRIGWWTPQDDKENFMKTTTLSCHTETGRYAYYKELPEHLTRRIKV